MENPAFALIAIAVFIALVIIVVAWIVLPLVVFSRLKKIEAVLISIEWHISRMPADMSTVPGDDLPK
jgi:uncharacterized protein YoxC